MRALTDFLKVMSSTSGCVDRAAAERAAQLLPRLVVLDAGGTKGRGVFALERIARGRVVERAPVLVFPSTEWDAHARHTLLSHYAFRWPPCRAPETRPRARP